jgi:hypothetical protein
MAARAKYPTPHAQLGALMVEARREGLTFQEFWERAVRPDRSPVVWRTPVADRPVGCVVWSNDTAIRAADREVYRDARVRDGWRRAYERLPERRRDTALKRLAGELDLLLAA